MNDKALGAILFGVAAVAVYSYLRPATNADGTPYDGTGDGAGNYASTFAWPDSWDLIQTRNDTADLSQPADYVAPVDTNASVNYDDGSDVVITAEEYIPPPPPQMVFGYFSDLGDKFMGSWKVREYPKYASAISEAERRYGLPTDLLGVTLYKESRYRPDVISGVNRSPVGALGIAQFMPGTAAELGINPLDPFASIDAAGKYLKRQYDNFHDWKTALMAYNWGPGNVANWLKKTVRPPLNAETSDYVAFITANVPGLA